MFTFYTEDFHKAEKQPPYLRPLGIALMARRIKSDQANHPAPEGNCPHCWHGLGRAIPANNCKHSQTPATT